MIQRIILVLLLLCAGLTAQAQFLGSRSVWLFDGPPTVFPTAGRTPEISYDITTRRFYGWDRATNTWELITSTVNGVTEAQLVDSLSAVRADFPTQGIIRQELVDSLLAVRADITSNGILRQELIDSTLAIRDDIVSGGVPLSVLQDTASAIRGDFPVDTRLTQSEVRDFEADATALIALQDTAQAIRQGFPVDTDTQLSPAEVQAAEADAAALAALQDTSVAIRGDFPVDTDTQLSPAEVQAAEADAAALAALQDTSVAIRGDFPVDTDTQLSPAEVQAAEADAAALAALQDTSVAIRGDFPVPGIGRQELRDTAIAIRSIIPAEAGQGTSPAAVRAIVNDSLNSFRNNLPTDTNTQLTKAEVNAFEEDAGARSALVDTAQDIRNSVDAIILAAQIAAQDYADANDDNTQLTPAEVRAAEADAIALAEIANREAAIRADFPVDTDTQLTPAQVQAAEADAVALNALVDSTDALKGLIRDDLAFRERTILTSGEVFPKTLVSASPEDHEQGAYYAGPNGGFIQLNQGSLVRGNDIEGLFYTIHTPVDSVELRAPLNRSIYHLGQTFNSITLYGGEVALMKRLGSHWFVFVIRNEVRTAGPTTPPPSTFVNYEIVTDSLLRAANADPEVRTVYVNNQVDIDGNLFTGAQVNYEFGVRGALVADDGAAIRLYGQVSAGFQHIFVGPETDWMMPRMKVVKADWFGATSDGVADPQDSLKMSVPATVPYIHPVRQALYAIGDKCTVMFNRGTYEGTETDIPSRDGYRAALNTHRGIGGTGFDESYFGLQTYYSIRGKSNTEIFNYAKFVGQGLDETLLVPTHHRANAVRTAGYRHTGWLDNWNEVGLYEDNTYIGDQHVNLINAADTSKFPIGSVIYAESGGNYFDQDHGEFNVVVGYNGNRLLLRDPFKKHLVYARTSHIDQVTDEAFTVPAIGEQFTISTEDMGGTFPVRRGLPGGDRHPLVSIGFQNYQLESANSTSFTLINRFVTPGTVVPAGADIRKARVIYSCPESPIGMTIEGLTIVGRRDGITVSNSVDFKMKDAQLLMSGISKAGVPIERTSQTHKTTGLDGHWCNCDGYRNLTIEDSKVTGINFVYRGQNARSGTDFEIINSKVSQMFIEDSEFTTGFKIEDSEWYIDYYKAGITNALNGATTPAPLHFGNTEGNQYLINSKFYVSGATRIIDAAGLQGYNATSGKSLKIHNCDFFAHDVAVGFKFRQGVQWSGGQVEGNIFTVFQSTGASPYHKNADVLPNHNSLGGNDGDGSWTFGSPSKINGVIFTGEFERLFGWTPDNLQAKFTVVNRGPYNRTNYVGTLSNGSLVHSDDARNNRPAYYVDIDVTLKGWPLASPQEVDFVESRLKPYNKIKFTHLRPSDANGNIQKDVTLVTCIGPGCDGVSGPPPKPVINRVTLAQYEALTPVETEIYSITDTLLVYYGSTLFFGNIDLNAERVWQADKGTTVINANNARTFVAPAVGPYQIGDFTYQGVTYLAGENPAEPLNPRPTTVNTADAADGGWVEYAVDFDEAGTYNIAVFSITNGNTTNATQSNTWFAGWDVAEPTELFVTSGHTSNGNVGSPDIDNPAWVRTTNQVLTITQPGIHRLRFGNRENGAGISKIYIEKDGFPTDLDMTNAAESVFTN